MIGKNPGNFTRFAKWTARATGRPMAFITAASVIVVWGITGPLFHYSDTWQLVINTGTTVVTFLMVFLIQNTQNRDSQAMQIKLDEIIRATEGAHLALLDLEELEEEELNLFRDKYCKLATKARQEMQQGGRDTGTEDIDDSPPAPQRPLS